MNINELDDFWDKEKLTYEYKEIGDGVRKFVIEVLKSVDIFKLKAGLNSTLLQDRKYEFKEEESKSRRHADVVIFINSDIIIPMEIERYNNIKAGEKQILRYQLDWEKRYGILTDGYKWRFYNNNIYRSFTLDEILHHTKEFLEFWNEYIKPEFYYFSFFEPQGQQLLEERESLEVETNRPVFFDDITNLIKSFKTKLKLEGYFENLDKRTREKTAIEITYAYIVQFILYKTLVDNNFGSFTNEFAVTTERIHKSLKNKSYKEILGLIDGISNKISENIYRPFSKEQELINKKLVNLYRSIENELSDVSPWLDIFIFIKKYDFANIRNEIFGYIYENYLKELYEESKKGQYYTDPSVVNFMLTEMGYTKQNLRKRQESDKNSISLIDPACGSGTFLYTAVDNIVNSVPNGSQESSRQIEELVNNNVFGLDIEEFPLYLAEMSILMRMLTIIINEKYNNPVEKKIKVFKTKDSIAEFANTSIIHATSEQLQQTTLTGNLNIDYDSYVRDERDLKEMKGSLGGTPQIPRRRFDYVIANPPYIDYNTCSKQKLLFTQLIQNGTIQMSNIYGMNLNTVSGHIKAYAPKPNLYAFFIALGLALLKHKGKMCYIIPQTILTSTDLDVLRYHLSKFVTLEKIYTFEGNLFIGRGLEYANTIPTSSLIFIARNENPKDDNQVNIINYNGKHEEINKIFIDIASKRRIEEKVIKQKDLLTKVLNWNFIKWDSLTSKFYQTYLENTESIDVYREYKSSRNRFGAIFQFDKGLVFAKNKIEKTRNVPSQKDYYFLIKIDKRKYGLDLSDMAINKKHLLFPKGSQGLAVYDKHYKIVWRYMNPEKFYFTDKKVMFNFNYILISSDNKEEILYLLSLLNSRLIGVVLNILLANAAEKDFLLGIKAIKNCFRVPIINEKNKNIKSEVIKEIEKLLILEDKCLADFVDFSNLMIQKFTNVVVDGNTLVLSDDKKSFKYKINENPELISEAIENNKSKAFNLSDLKYLSIIDLKQQKIIKDYVDDLIFALYFEIDIKHIGLIYAKEIHEECKENKFYKLVES